MPIRRLHSIASAVVVAGAWAVSGCAMLIGEDRLTGTYDDHCARCHGEQMHRSATGPRLVDVPPRHRASVDELTRSIAHGFPADGMPAMTSAMTVGISLR